MSNVLDAFDGSVTYVPHNFQRSHVSIVHSAGDDAVLSDPLSINHFIFVAEKYESKTSPVVFRTMSL